MKRYTLTVSPREFAAILAGLRVFQGMQGGKKPTFSQVDDIASDVGKFHPLSAKEIDPLCERLNLAPTPRLVVVLEGGLVQDILSDIPLVGTVLDYDTEGADDEELVSVPQCATEHSKAGFEPAYRRACQIDVLPARIDEILAAVTGAPSEK